VLGLDANASLAEIKQAHRKLVKQHHPDLGGSAEAFRRVNEAYQSLVQ
jgi:curved DNA-binding protein CbpA